MTDPELTTKYREAVTLGGGHVERTVRLLQCITHPEITQLRAQVTAVRAVAADMRTWCSPNGLADHYADAIELALDGQIDERQQITALVQLIRDAQHRIAVLDPERCPADCAEGHTYRAPCSIAHPTVGEPGTTAVITLPLKMPAPSPIIVQPCATDPLTAADQRQDAPVPEFRIVATHPLEQLAAEFKTLHRFIVHHRNEQARTGITPSLLGNIGFLDGTPIIPDNTLPPGEIHLRPWSRPADGPS